MLKNPHPLIYSLNVWGCVMRKPGITNSILVFDMVAETQVFELLPAASQVCIRRNLQSGTEPGLMDMDVPTSILTARLSSYKATLKWPFPAF